VHESGHEWWGNSITTNDIADMWVHEGFCTYAEVLYVECMYGYDAMLSYVNNQKRSVRNDKPVIGPYHVNKGGSSDMYFKGSLMLHTLRSLIEDDKLWFEIIKGISNDFKYQTIDGQVIINYINEKSGKDFTDFFNQYLKNKEIPEFQYKLQQEGRNITLLYRWEAITNFDMPILINTGRKDFWVYPNEQWKEMDLGSFDKHEFRIRDDLFFIDVKKQ
jgi:aminopeptidase N